MPTAPTVSPLTDLTLDITEVVRVRASLDDAFDALLEELGPGNHGIGDAPMPMVLEARPGGRWFRDLGPTKGYEGQAGHLWGHVQVIKPPKLLEIRGPLFMSYSSVNFIRYRFNEEEGGTRLDFLHQAFGLIPADHREGVNEGWDYTIERIGEIAAKLLAAKGGKR